MELTNTFEVGVPPEEAWAILTDVERIAPCLPGAQLTEVAGDEYRGVVKVKVGPITAQYKGTARFVERDEGNLRAVLEATGRDTRGQGNASATIAAQLVERDGGTHVELLTDLNVTGKVAQFGRGVLADVSAKLLGQFVDNLERTVLSEPQPTGGATMTDDDTTADGGGAAAPADKAAKKATKKAAAKKAAKKAPAKKATKKAAAKKTTEATATEAPAAETPAAVEVSPVEAETVEVSAALDAGPQPAGVIEPGEEAAGVLEPGEEAAGVLEPGEAAVAALEEAPPAEPEVRRIDSPEVEPVDLMDAAGGSVAKRLVPLLLVVALVVLLLGWLRRRRSRA